MFNKRQLKKLSQEELISLLLETEREKEEAQARVRGLSTIITSAFRNCKEVVLLADKYLVAQDKWTAMTTEEQINHMLEALRRLAENTTSQFQAFVGKGSEKIGAPEAQKEIERSSGSWANSKTRLQECLNLVDKVVTSLNNETGLEKEFKAIVQEPGACRSDKKTGQSKGRQKVILDNIQKRSAAPSQQQSACKKCSTDMVKASSFTETMRRRAQTCLSNLETLTSQQDVYICPKCGEVHVVLPEDADHPVNSSRTVGTSMLIELAAGLYSGIPLQRQIKELQKTMCFGHDTISYNLHDLARYYLRPLAKLYESSLKQTKVLIADETEFSILEAQGKGRCAKENEDEQRTKNYLLALTTAENAQEPIYTLNYLESRSAEAIGAVITKDFSFETLVSDGYSAYRTVLKSWGENRKHQSCLIHYRRKLINALSSSSFLKELQKSGLTDKEKQQEISNRVKKSEPTTSLLICIEALSKLYSLQAQLSEEKREKERIEIRKRQGKLMESIDSVMAYQATKLCPATNTNSYRKGSGGLYAAACAYYMNQSKEFKVFLDDLDVPADSNLVENRLRPVTVLRKNIWYKQSIEYAKDMCDIYSVFKTLELNDIRPVPYLLKYCRSVYHLLDKAWTKALKDGHDSENRLGSLNLGDLTDYDFSQWLPRNFKKNGI